MIALTKGRGTHINKVAGTGTTEAPRSRTGLTASNLNSRLDFRRCIIILQLQKHLIFVSTKPGAG